MDFQVYKVIEGVFIKLVLFVRPGWEQFLRNLHVFIFLQRSFKIKVINVKTYILCSVRTDGAVSNYLVGGDV
jgi:hypothetical protein